MSDVVDLAIKMTAEASDAVSAADDVGDAYTRMATDVDEATRKADGASSRMDAVAESTDNVASRSSQAAGGLGDMAGALATTGLISEGTAAAMESGAAAIMGVTGAADLLNLVTTSTIVVKARERAATIASTVATRGQAAATRTAAVAQRVFNAAMRASPIGLVITAILLVAGAFAIAYRRSETFRAIVNAVMDRVRSAVGGFLDRVRDIPEAFTAARDKATAALRWVGDKVDAAADAVRDAAGAVRNGLGGAFDWVMDKVQPIVDAIDWIVDKLASIDLPNLPGLGRVSTTGGGGVDFGGGTVEEHYHFHGILPAEEDALVRVMDRVNKRRRRTTGRRVVMA